MTPRQVCAVGRCRCRRAQSLLVSTLCNSTCSALALSTGISVASGASAVSVHESCCMHAKRDRQIQIDRESKMQVYTHKLVFSVSLLCLSSPLLLVLCVAPLSDRIQSTASASRPLHPSAPLLCDQQGQLLDRIVAVSCKLDGLWVSAMFSSNPAQIADGHASVVWSRFLLHIRVRLDQSEQCCSRIIFIQ